MKRVVVFLILLACIKPAIARENCESALVRATYNSFSADSVDWRLASEVTEQEYDQIKHEAGASAKIFGISIGASYGDFKKRVQNLEYSLNTSLSRDQALNVMWTGLDPNGANAYMSCLQAEVLDRRGLHLAVKWATQTDVAVIVSWIPQGTGDPNTITVGWNRGLRLPRHITAGETTIVVRRPNKSFTLYVDHPGFTDSVVIEPLPPAPPAPQAPSAPTQMSCGTLDPNLTTTAFSDVPPGKGFDPKISSDISPISVPKGEKPNLASIYSGYHFNGGGEAWASITTMCDPLQLGRGELRAVLRMTISLTGLSGHCCSGFAPGGDAIAQPTWQTLITLPSDQARRRWRLTISSTSRNSIPTLNCKVVEDGQEKEIPFGREASYQFELEPGVHQVGTRCVASQELIVRPGSWDTRKTASADVTLSMEAKRE